jgi:hypothetical protein
MTPEEYMEERETCYPEHAPFIDRIEECMQRYRARRRLDSKKSNMFDKYLLLGGVETGPRQFQGMKTIGAEDMSSMTAAELRQATAVDAVGRFASNTSSRHYDPLREDDWEVDFTGVAAGFL